MKNILRKTLQTCFLCSGIFLFSQLKESNIPLWEKAPSTLQDSAKCRASTLLNFNCNIKAKRVNKDIKYKKDQSHSLIVVHASKDGEWIWKNQENEISLGNEKYQKEKRNQIIALNKRPSIYSYVSSSADKNLSADSIRIKFEDDNLYELIFTPKRIKPFELSKIHTYLSLKYGVSLEKGKYYDSAGKVIWDPGKHKDFQYRPTGIGRDDGNELYQRQSWNQSDLFLAIGKGNIERTNNENKAIFDNKTFAIWSDDGKDMALQNEGTLDILKRNWKINFIGTIPTSGYKVQIKKSVINPKSLPKIYWMIFKKQDGTYTKFQGSEREDNIIFDNVNFIADTSGSAVFTFGLDVSKKGMPSTPLETISGESNIGEEHIKLYPNPVKAGHIFTVEFPSMEDVEIMLYSGDGRLLSTQKIDSKATRYQNYVKVQGLYLINISQKGKHLKTFKLIVQ